MIIINFETYNEDFNWNPFRKKRINKHSDVDPYGEENWDDDDIENKFKDFLTKHKSLENYKDNLKTNGWNDIDEYLTQANPTQFIRGAFYWKNTNQGGSYWTKLNVKWMIKLKKINRIYEKNEDIDPYGEENWDELDPYALFKKFLVDNKIYKRYIDNVYDQFRKEINDDNFEKILNNIKPGRFIDYIYWWSTPEGHEYWNRIDQKWLSVLKKNS